jgi:N-acetylneuraminate synthase
VSQGELLNRETLGKSVVASRAIRAGETFDIACLRIASPGQGLAPYRLSELLGKTAQRDLAKGDFLFPSDLEVQRRATRRYTLPIRHGVPVRYHDFSQYAEWIKPDLFEFHLSYRDLGLDPAKFLAPVDCTRLVVHAPELFENSELLDLTSSDPAYRARSIANLQRVVDATQRIGKFFPHADSMLIIANVGGFSADAPLAPSQRAALYEQMARSCEAVDFGATELLPQNMPPLPWHFGGQRYQNLFMMPEEIAQNCRETGRRICLDLSHLSMTCSYFELDFQAALELLMPYTAHIHVADATGSSGEGVPPGEGDIDWQPAWSEIARWKQCGFIPEVWQGHKDHGAGFWSALDYLSVLSVPCKDEA